MRRQTLLLALLTACSTKGGDGGGDEPTGVGGGQPPTVTLASPASGTTVAQLPGVAVALVAADPDSPLDELALAWSSSEDGAVDGPASVASDGTAQGTLSLSHGAHTLTVTVTDPDGQTGTDTVDVVVDGAPAAPIVDLTPADPSTDDPLVATVADTDLDPEGEPVTLRFAWQQDGVESLEEGDTVSASDTRREQSWTVQVWASDGLLEGPPGEASVTVGPPCDQDGDGALDDHDECGGDDCDDTDPNSFPGNDETWYDGVDQDCDGADDYDADGDGVPLDEDCDDTDSGASPEAAEDCFDGVDNDCDGQVDACTESIAGATAIIAGDVGESMGTPVVAGDVNGDGVPDVWFGGTYADENGGAEIRGMAHLHLGPLSGTLVADEGVASVRGAARFDHVGRVLAPAGDLDGDGYDDTWHGAYSNGEPCYGWTSDDCNQGEAWLFYGPLTGTLSEGDTDHRLIGEGSIDYAASSLAALDDADGDGVADLVVGGWGWSPGSGVSTTGAIYWLTDATAVTELADADTRVRGDQEHERFGWLNGIVNAGDTDGDGLDEVWVGAHYGGFDGSDPASAEGKAYLFRGVPASTTASSAADFVVEGDRGGDWFGFGVAAGGDLNGDGYDDVVASSANNSVAPGNVYIFHGPVTTWGAASSVAAAVLTSTTALGRPGLGMAPAGDIDGDGHGELWVGLAAADTDHQGAAVLMAGPLTGTVSLGDSALELQGAEAGGQLGHRLVTGDLDSDGVLDLLVTAPRADLFGVGGTPPGALYVWPGSAL